ncbi:MAG: anaerobic ribonucleoside-triphosphate reductase activating protein [Candidatus Margulisiibacteriota bacterium]
MFDLLESSFVDYPGKISAVIFFPGCQFRCPFCQNPDLVLNKAPASSNINVLCTLLKKRAHLLDGVCITGGEPLLRYKELCELIQVVKSIDRGSGNPPFVVKLDTNGYAPDRLENLLKANRLDYIAMDIKTSPAKYPEAAGLPGLDIRLIERSIELIRSSGIDYEFRTTVVPDFFTDEDAKKIGEWLKDSKKYALQQFSNRNNMLDETYKEKQPYPSSKLREFKKILEPFFEKVEVRGI